MPPSNERVLQASPVRLGRTIVAPIQLQLSGDDVVTLKYKTSALSATTPELYVSYRILTPDGSIVDGLETVQVVFDNFFHAVRFQLREGFLLTMTVTSAFSSFIGQVFVQAYISKLSAQNNSLTIPLDVVVLPLIQGYVSLSQQLAWPNSLYETILDEGWYPARYQPAAPGAGNQWAIQPPAGTYWKLQSVTALFSTSGVAGNRLANLFVSDPTVTVFPWIGSRSPAIAAALQIRICWSLGTTRQNALAADTWNAEVPEDLRLGLTGDTLRSGVAGMLAGDTWTQIDVCVLEKVAF